MPIIIKSFIIKKEQLLQHISSKHLVSMENCQNRSRNYAP